MKYFYKNHIATYMLVSALLILGCIGFSKLSVSLFPHVNYPGISIIIQYPGTSPEKVEAIITKPIEKAIKTVPGIEKINSVSEEGQARININFKINTDIKIAALQVREKIGIIRDTFPRDVQEPVVVRYDPSDKPVIIATVNISGCSQNEIREFAERKIKPPLQRIDGISEVMIVGGAQKEVHIDIDNMKYEARDLSYDALYQSIQKNNVSLPAGRLRLPSTEYNVYTAQKYATVDQIAESSVMPISNGSIMSIGDISHVGYSWKEKEEYSRYNGEENITLYIHQAGDANTLMLCRDVDSVLKSIQGCSISIIYNQGDYVRSALRNAILSYSIGAFLTCLILLVFFRRIDFALIIVMAIPVSMIISFLFMYYFHIELNMMSIAGLSLGASIIVDNGIVISSALVAGQKISRSYILDTVNKLQTAILASTISTIVVFFPILFSREQTRQMYEGLAYTIAIVLLVSLFVVLIVFPVTLINMCERKFEIQKIKFFKMPFSFKEKVDRASKLMRKYEEEFTARYTKFLQWSLMHTRIIASIIGISLLIAVIGFISIKKELIDPMSSDEFYVYIEFPSGTMLDVINEAVKNSEDRLRQMSLTEKITTKVEKWRGTLTIKLDEKLSTDKKKEDAKKRIQSMLAASVQSYKGFVYLTEAEESNARELDIVISGGDNDRIRELAKESAKQISRIQGIDDIVLRFRDGCPEFRFAIDRNKANNAGASPAEIGNYLRTSVFGPVISKFIDKDKEIDIRMRIHPEQVSTLESLKRIRIPSGSKGSISIGEVTSVSEAEGETKIWRQNGKRCVTITVKIGKLSYEDAVQRIDDTLKKVKWPEDYGYEYDDIVKNIHESRNSMMMALLLSVVLVYMILSAKFESLFVPLIMMCAIPLSFGGVIIALSVSGGTLNFAVYIGLIVLIGIMVNNGIVLVNSINDVYEQGKMNLKNLQKVVLSSSLSRLRPVSITAITTTVAMLPALIRGGSGSNLWRPLSFTVIVGLVFSYIITLLIIPVFSKIVYQIKIMNQDKIIMHPLLKR